MINQEVKGTLAKLLATENLNVEHRRVSTASFDVDKRLLILPIWKTASSTVYDLLVGHEVGHALYTPNTGFGDAPKAFVNVLEDARIERMMKVTYPGLRKSFFKGYKELWDDDFFGVKGEELDKLPLIDRINLYYKGNTAIPFDDDEMQFVDAADVTNSFEEVVDLAKRVYEYSKVKQEQKEQQSPENLPEIDMEGEGDSADEEEKVQPESSDEGDNEDGEDEKDWFTDRDPMDEDSYGDDDPAHLDVPSYEKEYDETKSITEEALRDALETLVDDDQSEWIYLSLPDVDVDKLITPAATIQEELNCWFYGRPFEEESSQNYYFRNLEYAMTKYDQYKKDSRKTINYLVKQFEMKKSADEYRRAATSKTGVINTNKLHTYLYNEDIFKKVTTIPEGKNHGLIMHIDWSGSMSDVLLDTLKQTFNLVWFCKKVGIPFRVYAFQDGYSHSREEDEEEVVAVEPKQNQLAISKNFKLLEFLSSRQNAKSLEKSMQLIFLQAFAMGGWRIGCHPKFGLGGTPLVDAVLCTRKLVSKLRNVEKVSKVNVICLTDGESNPIAYNIENDADYPWADEFRQKYLCHAYRSTFFLKDRETGYTRKISSVPFETTKEIVSFFREITDYNWIGIRICSKNELTRIVRHFAYDEFDQVDKQWKKNRFASLKNQVGFTEAFYMPNQGIGSGSHELEVKQKNEVATKAELQRAFKKHMGSKMTNKTILNAFIEQIA